MAEQQNTSGVQTNSFTKGLLKDLNETFVGEGFWSHARNAVNNSHDGQTGVLGNEPSTLSCIKLPYDYIGSIHLLDDEWAIFTTDDTDSEIGIFDESKCSYTKIVNDSCLNFKKSNPISGVFRKKGDCTREIYFSDGGRNFDRHLNLDEVPYKYTIKTTNGCAEKVYDSPLQLDCEAMRFKLLTQHPCIQLKKSYSAGSLPNGSYQVVIAYNLNRVRVSDYIAMSEVQSLFDHEGPSGALDITITNLDQNYDEFELVLISNINFQTTARRIGYYSTSTGHLIIDRVNLTDPGISFVDITLRTDAIDKSDSMYQVNDYLLKIGIHYKYKFNYQQQANRIKTYWNAVQYPSEYYRKAGNNTGYMRDEQYAFFIRWIHNTGERTESYHIPGRVGSGSEKSLFSGTDSFELNDGVSVYKWQVTNTATITELSNTKLSDGGLVIAKGEMGYWESTEVYPSNKEIWGDLCGQPIRHHKFPDETLNPLLSNSNNSGNNIVILGVQFENITHPLDQNGDPIESIVGYEILRGSREGNKTIVGKGLLNNMREYTIPGNNNKGLFQNYPYNDLREDPYLTEEAQTGTNGSPDPKTKLLNTPFKKNIFSFHSPEFTFNNPFLNSTELKIYQEQYGISLGKFETPYKHPRFKVSTDFTSILSKVISLLDAVDKIKGAFSAKQPINFTGTEDAPFAFTIDKPDFPTKPTASGVAAIAAWAKYAFDVITYGISVVAITALNLRLAAVRAEKLYDTFMYLVPKIQYAAQYISHGFYNNSTPSLEGNRRRKILNSLYVGSNIQSFLSNQDELPITYQINNLYRSKNLIFEIDGEIDNPTTVDNSRFIMGNSDMVVTSPAVTRTIASHYGALKINIPSQYGQLDSIKQMTINSCVNYTNQTKEGRFKTDVLFGGDVYINRFTEKNTMYFFNDWLMGEPDEIHYDYTLYINIPYPRFWINNTEKKSAFKLANDYRVLDKRDSDIFYIKRGYFYLFNSGVRDFFVESEINLAYRDWEEDISKRHYDPYRFEDLQSLFRSDIIKSGNYYKYDYSLSISKLLGNQITWGNILPPTYDPQTYSTCYTYMPNRVVYSLPQRDTTSNRDNWRIYLPNNYKDFTNKITSIKSINKTGALFMMYNRSPLSFMGVEELKLDGTNTKITIGDGALFSNAKQLQEIVNVDESYEYGSCQSKNACVNTPYGLFWVSQNQGKVFNYTGSINDISKDGMKWWFAKYLPSEILNKVPDYPFYDNPSEGIGLSMIYDNTNDIIYITKKDYKPLVDNLYYDSEFKKLYTFSNGQKMFVSLTDNLYFEDASWTISYDPKNKMWISFHDWHPNGLLPGKNHFMSIKDKTIWKHNLRCDSFCNFYGKDYPFEIEFISSTGQTVNSVRNVEYILEAYKYHNDCRDKFHVLDENFDQAFIYNSEQISGRLNLINRPKNNPILQLQYPFFKNDSIDIICSKEENKYRFNQFYDVTKNRSEFIDRNVPMFKTKANGYEYNINPDYINYTKSPLQHKKFRHYTNRVLLKKSISNDVKFLFKMSNQKTLQSPR